MEKQQTAVEWLINRLILDETSSNYNKLIIDKAKQKEKEQIIDAWEDGCYSYFTKNSEQYYNETFKK
jgi:hypothetical protein